MLAFQIVDHATHPFSSSSVSVTVYSFAGSLHLCHSYTFESDVFSSLFSYCIFHFPVKLAGFVLSLIPVTLIICIISCKQLDCTKYFPFIFYFLGHQHPARSKLQDN